MLTQIDDPPDDLAKHRTVAPPRLALSYGQAKSVLISLGFASGVSEQTFDYYIKSLRKFGVPFERVTSHGTGRQLARYNFHHLMELCLALTLRVYWTLPDAVLQGIIEHRRELYSVYDTAFMQSSTGIGAAVRVTTSTRRSFTVSGVYLDPQLHYGGGRLLRMGAPRVMTPFEALTVFGTDRATSRTHLPLNVTSLALRVADHAQRIAKMRTRLTVQL